MTVCAIPPTPTISAPNGVNVCSINVVLIASPTGYTFNWSDGETTQSISPSSVKSFSVRLINACGSSSPSSNTITTKRSPSSCPIARLAQEDSILPSPQNLDLPDVEELKAYPNPANDEVTIATPSVAKTDRQVWVYDMFGKACGMATLKKGEWKTTISTKEIAEGLYIINVSYGDWINATKMMVLHK